MSVCAEELMRTSTLTQVVFFDAANAWLETRRPYIASKTFHEYQLNIKTLSLYFGEMRLPEITPDLIRSYQRMRMTQCGPHGINHECSVLQQMLKRIGRWTEMAQEYQPLPLPKEKRGRALRDDERKNLLDTASSNPNWMAAYLATALSINTTAGPKEVATLRIQDIVLENRTMRVQPEGSKNVHRTRIIPLNDEAFVAAKMALDRAASLGSVEPDHYLFPFRKRGGNRHKANYDPARHQTTFKTAWNKLKKAANLTNFRMYDLRHHAITVLLENPETSEETAEAVAGHISREMKKRYSHVRIDARRRAVEALFPKPEKKAKKPAKSEVSTESTDAAKQLIDLLGKLLKTG